jgi:metal-responsive CopG/Arc/MetJ family transcriptional regulator
LNIFMPGKGNPLLSVRLEPELNELLPTERGERSRIVKEALRAYLCPPEAQDELSMLKQQMEVVQRVIARIGKV